MVALPGCVWCISDGEPSRLATITKNDGLTVHIGTAPNRSPIGGHTESLITGHRAPARGCLGVIEHQVKNYIDLTTPHSKMDTAELICSLRHKKEKVGNG